MALDLMLDISYTDVTLNEARGNYKNMKSIFDKEIFGANEWMVESNISMLWQTDEDAPLPMNGFFEAKVHAHANGDMVIKQCSLPAGISRDIEVFSTWAQLNHWNRPKISDELLGNHMLNWKYYWDTFLLDSDLLTKKFGEREQNFVDSDINIS